MPNKTYTSNPAYKPKKAYSVFYYAETGTGNGRLYIEKWGTFWYGFMMIAAEKLEGSFTTEEEAELYITNLSQAQMRSWCLGIKEANG